MEVTIRPRRPDDDARIVELRALADPDFPPGTVEDYRTWLESAPTDLLAERWVAESDGIVLGSSGLFEMRVTEQGAFQTYIRIHPQSRKQGIGGKMYEHIMNRALEAGASRLYGYVRENDADALGFLQRRGVRRSGESTRMSRLEVRSARLEGLTGEEERLRSEGIRIESLEAMGADDESLLRALYQLDSTTSKDMPSTEHEEHEPFDVWLRRDLRAPGAAAEACWLALDGDRLVGETRLTVAKDGTAVNAYTGVDRAYRGRGIARALKLRTVEWCAQNDVEYIYTGNANENKRMLAINVHLGYAMLPRSIEMVKALPAPGVESVTDRLIRLLREHGAEFEVMTHDPVRTSEEAARVRGTPLEQGAKAMVYRADGRVVLLVLAANRRIDSRAFKRAFQVKDLRLISPNELQELTGLQVGAVPPFGILLDLPTYVDEGLLTQPRLSFNAGSRTTSVILATQDYTRLAQAIPGNFASAE